MKYGLPRTTWKPENQKELSLSPDPYAPISRALEGQYIALRPTKDDGLIDVFYCHQKIKTLDLRAK